MNYIAKIRQVKTNEVVLTLYRGGRRYSQHLTEEEANQLAYKLMSFTASQQDLPFYLTRKDK